MITIISLGGSIVAPEQPDTALLSGFTTLMRKYLEDHREHRLILIVGGGGPARVWQGAASTVNPGLEPDRLDWIGIMATRLNAELVRGVLADLAPDPVVTDPTAPFGFTGRVLVAAGWKPGFSTDFDAVVLAERFGARQVVNLSNIEKVYTDDPRKNPGAKALDQISWREFTAMVGDTWTPGKNTPFDPVASKRAAELGLSVICASGKNLQNLARILEGEDFVGTTIS